MQYAVNHARAVKPDLKLGICGEHGGDAASIEFCYRLGLNYVSCSPYRVPLARLAGAQAVLNNSEEQPGGKRGRGKAGSAKSARAAKPPARAVKEAKPAKAAKAPKPAKAPAKPAGAAPDGTKRGRGRPKKS
jgi:pyruvate,orthophosphate dikinase